jgi:hypothetical protein
MSVQTKAQPNSNPEPYTLSRIYAVGFGEHTRPRVCRPAPSPVGGGLAAVTKRLATQAPSVFREGAENCTRGRVRSRKPTA